MSDPLRKLGDLDRTIHEPARLMIVATLYVVGRADFLYLQRETQLTKGNLSSHLARLEEVGYVAIEKVFRAKKPLTLCSLTKEGRGAFRQYQLAVKRALF